MGVLPLTFPSGHNADTLRLDGTETFEIEVNDGLRPRREICVSATRSDGEMIESMATAGVDTPVEVEYLRHGGILHMVLRRMAAE